MAAKDADLAHDYSTLQLVLIGEDVATVEIDTTHLDMIALLPIPTNDLTLFLTEEKEATLIADLQGVVSASGAVYRMRGYDSTETRTVYWDATTIDAAGAEYTGPGPLANVVVSIVIC
jgi:hypothetical protein